MNEKVVLIGASIEIVTLASSYGVEVVGYVDALPTPCGGVKYLGTDEDYLKNAQRYDDPHRVVITVDDCAIRDRLYDHYKSEGAEFASLLFGHISPLADVGEGCIVLPGARVSDRSILEENCRLNFDALVGHDNRIMRSVILAPRAVSLGHVRVEERTYVGANSTICPHVKVGSDVLVSAGSTVAQDLKRGSQVMGYYPLPKMHVLLPNARARTTNTNI